MDDFGLYFFNARWYDPSLGRFAQADSIIPGAGDPQAWDRYAYVNNNALRYTDPTGHMLDDCNEGCDSPDPGDPPDPPDPGNDDPDDGEDDSGNDDGGGGGQPLLMGLIGDPPPPVFPPSPFACEWLDCTLSAVSTLATGVALATMGAPEIAGVAVIVDVVATIWAVARTESDYSQGEISNTRRWLLNGTGLVGLLPTSAGLGLSVVNSIFTFSGFPE